MKEERRKKSIVADYLGNYLRSEVPINQLIRQCEFILDTLKLDGVKNVRKLVAYYNEANKIVYNLRGLRLLYIRLEALNM